MFFTQLSNWEPKYVLIRILVSLILGMIIGLDRGAKRRGGGARTTLTVCLGATMVMLIEQYLEQIYPGNIDISRIAAQVVSGVGFLGAGTILVSGHHIKGLTSAASIWTSASIGLAVGIGFIDGAVILTAIWLFGLHMVPYVEEKIYRYTRYSTIYLEIEDGSVVTRISHKLKEDGCTIDTFHLDKPKAKGQSFQIVTTFSVPKGTNKAEYVQSLRDIKGVKAIDEV